MRTDVRTQRQQLVGGLKPNGSPQGAARWGVTRLLVVDEWRITASGSVRLRAAGLLQYTDFNARCTWPPITLRCKLQGLNSPKGDRESSIMFMLSDARRTQIIRILLWTALALFVLSLFSPSVSGGRFWRDDLVCKAPQWSRGWELLLLGPLSVLDGQFGWIANPLMLFAALTRTAHPGFALTAVALIVVTAFSFTSVWMDGGGNGTVCSFGLGYYLWLACSVLVLIATLLRPAKRYAAPNS
jgi:hypothetical protein